MTFDEFRKIATDQATQHLNGDPIDLNETCDALVVTRTLFDWIAFNATYEQKTEIAMRIREAINSSGGAA